VRPSDKGRPLLGGAEHRCCGYFQRDGSSTDASSSPSRSLLSKKKVQRILDELRNETQEEQVVTVGRVPGLFVPQHWSSS